MKNDSFIFRRSFFDAIRLMPSEIQGEIYAAVAKYALDGVSPKGISDASKAIFLIVKDDIDRSSLRRKNGKKGAAYGKLGGRPATKPKAEPKPKPKKEAKPKAEKPEPKAESAKPTVDPKPKAEAPASQPEHTLTLVQEIEQLKADATWREPVCMKFRITDGELASRLDAFLSHCQCECEGKPHKDITDAKRHFMSWSRKAYKSATADTAGPQPLNYEYNGGFGGQDV